MTIPAFNRQNLEQLCSVLGDTYTGLTGSQIGRYLADCGIDDPNPTMTKRHRLNEALSEKQRLDGCANNICAFVQRVMNPVLYVDVPDYFDGKRSELNKVLAFEGLYLSDQGVFQPCINSFRYTQAARYNKQWPDSVSLFPPISSPPILSE